jgi:hypothetical protein
MKGTMRADEVTPRWVGNFVRPTLKKYLGAQGPLRPIMALEAPRPLLGAGFYMKKFVAYLNNFQRKKLFCVQTLTKLPELTVFPNKSLKFMPQICYAHLKFVLLLLYLVFLGPHPEPNPGPE